MTQPIDLDLNFEYDNQARKVHNFTIDESRGFKIKQPIETMTCGVELVNGNEDPAKQSMKDAILHGMEFGHKAEFCAEPVFKQFRGRSVMCSVVVEPMEKI